MVCILTEKPSAARNFAKALGGVKGTFNGESYEIISSLGHLLEFKSPAEQVVPQKTEYYRKWNLDHLPWKYQDIAWEYVIKKGAGERLRQIKAACQRADGIVIAADDDPTGEGSLLAWEILAYLGLDNSSKDVTRMFFADEAPASIQKAFKTRKQFANRFADPDYNKAFFRSQFDFMTMQFTRVATALGDGRSMLRQGRLKSPMVRLVGDQLARVAGYQKIPFYQNRFRDENGHVYTNKEETMFPNKEQVPMTYTPSSVTIDKQEMRHTAPPKLLDLAALAARLASKGYKTKRVLAVYQKMYEDQVVSYPRTEDKHVTSEQFKELLPLLPKIAKVVGVDLKLLTHTSMRKTHVKEGCAHGANRPGINVPSTLDELTGKYGPTAPEIYRILARNYLAMLAEDYEYISQVGRVTNYPSFCGTAQIPNSLGWKNVFSYDGEETDDSSSGLGKKASPFVFEGFPPKPAAPTLKWLVEQLEKHDVGTGATRASTYVDVTSESATYPLMTDTRGKLGMTPYGEMSYILLKDTQIGDVAVTEKLQQNMRDVADNKVKAETLLTQIEGMVLSDKQTMERNSSVLREKGIMMGQSGIQKEKITGTFNGVVVSFNREWGGHTFTDDEVKKLLNGEQIFFELTGQSGTYTVSGKFGQGTHKGRSYWGFQKEDKDMSGRVACKFKGKDINFKRTWGSHVFTDEEIANLIKGDEIAFETEGKNGTYLVTGKLGQGSFNGRKYWGFLKN